MRVLVLGGYGLIGSAVVTALLKAGHEVTGLGRDIAAACRKWPEVDWISHDLRRLLTPDDWRPLLAGIDAVVNAAGVLQDGPGDDVALVQSVAMRALFEAASGIRIVQISAVGADADAGTRFMTTKHEADAALVASRLDWIILRPGLVFGPTAYGGTAMLRALAAFPLVLPAAAIDSRIQTVSLDDVAGAAVAAIEGRLPMRRSYDLVEDGAHSLGDILIALRAWLGLTPARSIAFPMALMRAAFRLGDGVSRLGWRSPMRTTALRQIEAGVTGDPMAIRQSCGQSLSTLNETLRLYPAGVQERWFARMWLLKPVVLGTLALFWIASGLIGFWQADAAASLLTARGFSPSTAMACVLGGSVLDVALGFLLLFRRTFFPAALGTLALTLGYLAGAALFAPDLWADPLGPMIKTLPVMILTLVAMAIEDSR